MTTPGAAPPGRRAGQPSTRRPAADVHSITSADVSLAEDQARRARRYLVQMGLRLVCFLAAIFLADGWLRWVLVAAAVVLPYSAVLFANAGRDRVSYDSSVVVPKGPAELPPGPTQTPSDTAPPARGRVVEHVDDAPHDGDDGPSGGASPGPR